MQYALTWSIRARRIKSVLNQGGHPIALVSKVTGLWVACLLSVWLLKKKKYMVMISLFCLFSGILSGHCLCFNIHWQVSNSSQSCFENSISTKIALICIKEIPRKRQGRQWKLSCKTLWDSDWNVGTLKLYSAGHKCGLQFISVYLMFEFQVSMQTRLVPRFAVQCELLCKGSPMSYRRVLSMAWRESSSGGWASFRTFIPARSM